MNSETGVTCRPGGSELGMAGQRLPHCMRVSSAYTVCMHACVSTHAYARFWWQCPSYIKVMSKNISEAILRQTEFSEEIMDGLQEKQEAKSMC